MNVPCTIYSRFLSRTLKAMVEEQLNRSPGEQLQLFEELALIRHTAAQSVQLYDKAVGTDAEGMATALMRDALAEVRTMCEAAARVAAVGKDQMPAHVVNYIIMQIVKIAYATFGQDDPRMREFEQTMYEKIRVPDKSDGTMLTPDEDAGDMDATVPFTQGASSDPGDTAA